jgi:hypothetical protein
MILPHASTPNPCNRPTDDSFYAIGFTTIGVLEIAGVAVSARAVYGVISNTAPKLDGVPSEVTPISFPLGSRTSSPTGFQPSFSSLKL